MLTTTTTVTPPAHRSRRRKRALAVGIMLTGLAAAAPGIGTLAGFTSQDVNADNEITAGTLDVSFGQDARYFEVKDMQPRDEIVRKIDVRNGGSLAETYALDAVNVAGAGAANLDDVLVVKVEQDGKVLSEGSKLSELAAITGDLDPGAVDTFTLTVSWPDNAPEIDNKYQAGGVTFDLQVDANQF